MLTKPRLSKPKIRTTNGVAKGSQLSLRVQVMSQHRQLINDNAYINRRKRLRGR